MSSVNIAVFLTQFILMNCRTNEKREREREREREKEREKERDSKYVRERALKSPKNSRTA